VESRRNCDSTIRLLIVFAFVATTLAASRSLTAGFPALATTYSDFCLAASCAYVVGLASRHGQGLTGITP